MSEHICTPETCPDGANYFVTCVDYGRLWYMYMAGPYNTHREALAAVDPARKIGVANDGRAYFYAWGTVQSARRERGSITAAGLL
jgi:hypothetical protein